MWIPCLWLVLSSLRGSIAPAEKTAGYAYGHPFPIIFALLLAASLVVLSRRDIGITPFIEQNRLLVLFFLLMGLSIFWSPFPLVSLRRWIKTIGALFMILIVVTERDPFQALGWIMRRYFLLIVPLSLVLIIFFPSIGKLVFEDGSITWVGVTPNRNVFGKYLLLYAVFFIWSLGQSEQASHKRHDALALAITIVLLIAIGSITSFFSFLVALAAFAMISAGRHKSRHIAGIIIYLVALGTVSYLLMEKAIVHEPLAPMIVHAFGRDMTFTGRVDLWRDLWYYAVERPLLGYGYGGFWVWGLGHDLWDKYSWLPTGGHNGYIDIFLEMGAAGLALFFAMIVAGFREISRLFSVQFEHARLKMVLLLAILFHNLNESSMLINNPLWIFLLFTLVSSSGPSLASPPARRVKAVEDNR